MDSSSASPTTCCRKCGYPLLGLAEHRCPECGTRFDPSDGRTVCRSQRRWRIRRWVRLGVFTGGLLAGLLAIVIGVPLTVLYGQWKAEQAIIATLQRPGCKITTAVMPGAWHKEVYRLLFDNGLPWHECGWAGTGFVRLTERVCRIEYVDTTASQAELAKMAQLRWLNRVVFGNTSPAQ